MENRVDKKVAEQTGSATKKQNIKKCVEQKKGDNKTSVNNKLLLHCYYYTRKRANRQSFWAKNREREEK